MTTSVSKTDSYPIRARSHLLRLLGDELIGDDRLAVFELVKNGYDADATEVNVILDVERGSNSTIVVHDNGHGMSLDDIKSKWLELATDSKRRNQSKRTAKFSRLPLGEKGVGRLAAFKLGDSITLTTRNENGPELSVLVDWPNLLCMGEYIDDLAVSVTTHEKPKHFPDGLTGTRIEIGHLKRHEWARRDVRALFRLVTSLASPFETPERFVVRFIVPGRENDIKDMLKPEEFLSQAVWRFTFLVSGSVLEWDYSFNPPHWKALHPRNLTRISEPLQLRDEEAFDRFRGEDKQLFLRPEMLEGIGPISGVIYGFHRRREVLKASGNQTQLDDWLTDQVGIRVFRDGVRVFNYGEPNDDWLGLDVIRINKPTKWLGTKSLVASVHIHLLNSKGLKEKTNREGFEQNETFERLRAIMRSVFERFMQEHRGDRESLDAVIKGRTPGESTPRVHDAVTHIKAKLQGHPEFSAIKRELDAIEERFNEVQEVMVGAGMAGLNLAVVFHEVERSVDALEIVVDKGAEIKTLRAQIEHLKALLHTFAPLLRKNPTQLVFASMLVKSAKVMREHRFAAHHIVLSAPILTKEEQDFRVRGPGNLLVAAIGNLIDNAIYWARYRKERDGSKTPASILITTDWDATSDSGFIAVVDNGPGFLIPTTRAVEPFVSRRPGGMGLGLYFANLVMEQCGGALTIHDCASFRDEVAIPVALDGAAIVMRFGGSR